MHVFFYFQFAHDNSKYMVNFVKMCETCEKYMGTTKQFLLVNF